ncbi:MAG: hypothetical protein OEM97_09365 [Acidimicrobiia bacterium]|nr:hypothetical protein [Acidimicrobiia bacterium]
MTQEARSRAEREEQASEALAEQLDSLSRPLADRVLGRAIELDHEAREAAEAAAETIDYETLREVALEVGITDESLKKALLEEMNTERDHNARPVERATVPDVVRGGLIVPGAQEAVAERLRDYLERIEGLVNEGRSGMRSTWSDPSTRRMSPRVETWTVRQARGDRQLVEVDVETASARKRAWRFVIAISVLGLLFGNALGSLLVLGLMVAGIVTVVGWLKRAARRARRGINRALNALVDDDGDPPKDWLTVWERSQR